MKRIIHKIRLQSPEFRIMVAVIAALIVTLLIGALWATTLSTGTIRQEKTNTPGPLSSLISNIRNTVRTSQIETTGPFSSDNRIQVIDSGAETVPTTTQ